MSNTSKKVLKLVLDILLYLFMALCIFSVAITIFSKKDIDGAANVFGYQIRTVTTDSMGACEQTDVSGYDIGSIPKNSLVFIKLVPEDKDKADEFYKNIKEGDVLTFKYVYTSQVTITHRVIKSDPNSRGGYTIHLEGDNKSATDTQLTQVIHTENKNDPNYVIGKVTAKSYLIGLLITFLQSPLGLILVVIVPCLAIIVLEAIKISGMLGAEKKKKIVAENQKKDDELEELKRRLAELEGKTTPQDDNSMKNGDTEQ